MTEFLPTNQFPDTAQEDFARFPLNLLAPLKLRRAHLMADVPDGPGINRFREVVTGQIGAAASESGAAEASPAAVLSTPR